VTTITMNDRAGLGHLRVRAVAPRIWSLIRQLAAIASS
jgi:hypothetical protein